MIFARLLWFTCLALHFKHCHGAVDCLLDAFEIVSHEDQKSRTIFESLKSQSKALSRKEYDDFNDLTDDMAPVLTLAGLLEGKVHDKRLLTTCLKESLRLTAFRNGIKNQFNVLLANNYLQREPVKVTVPTAIPNGGNVVKAVEEAVATLFSCVLVEPETATVNQFMARSVVAHTLQLCLVISSLYTAMAMGGDCRVLLFYEQVYGVLSKAYHYINQLPFKWKWNKSEHEFVDVSFFRPSIVSYGFGAVTKGRWPLWLFEYVRLTPQNAKAAIEYIHRMQLSSESEGAICEVLEETVTKEKQKQHEMITFYCNLTNPAAAFYEPASLPMTGFHPILHILIKHFITTRVPPAHQLIMLSQFYTCDFSFATTNGYFMRREPLDRTVGKSGEEAERVFDKLLLAQDPDFHKDFEAVKRRAGSVNLFQFRFRLFFHSNYVSVDKADDVIKLIGWSIEVCDRFEAKEGMSVVKAMLIDLLRLGVKTFVKWGIQVDTDLCTSIVKSIHKA